jgi:ribose-phosphate pyrophosphokinase
VPLGQAQLGRFTDTEVSFQITENVRGADVFVVQPTAPPVNENLVELLVMIDAFKRSSAGRITAVLPYYGYARQDRKDRPRVGQIQGFFDIPVDHLFAAPVILDYVSSLNLDPLVIVSPDAGGVERARAYAKRLEVSLAVMDKRRGANREIETIHVIGDVAGKTALIVDDMCDSAGTLVRAVDALLEAKAERVLAACTHAVLSPPAVDRLNVSPIEKVIVTNTVPLRPEAAACAKIKVLSVAKILGQAIQSVHEETSVSSLFV